MRQLWCFILILLNIISISAQDKGWFRKFNELQKFPATEKDIERLFSPRLLEIRDSPKDWGKTIDYELPEGKLSVYYSTGRCTPKSQDGFDLDEGVIANLDFWLKIPIDFSKLKINLNEFIKGRERDIAIWFYTNKEKGITYTVIEGKLHSIRLWLPKQYLRSCEDLNKQPK